jgi:hypothetical protein
MTSDTSCRQTLASHGGMPTAVRLCGPPSWTELLPYALVIGVLLWPDLAEFGVAGVVTLKRRVREQEARQGALEAQVARFEQHVAQLAVANQTQTTTLNVGYSPSQEDVKRGISTKESEAESSPDNLSVDGVERESKIFVPEEAEDHARLLGEFLQAYSELEPFLMPLRRGQATTYNEEVLPAIASWNKIFGDELRAMRQTRNVAVHEPYAVSVDTLRAAIDNTRYLSDLLMRRLNPSQEAS